MRKFLGILVYILWTAAIICLLATTFTNFQYEDLNMLAAVLLIFALANSFFLTTRTGKD